MCLPSSQQITSAPLLDFLALGSLPPPWWDHRNWWKTPEQKSQYLVSDWKLSCLKKTMSGKSLFLITSRDSLHLTLIPPVFLPRRVWRFPPTTSQHSPTSAVQIHKARTVKAVQGPRYPRYSVLRLGLFLQENNLRSAGVQISGCCKS